MLICKVDPKQKPIKAAEVFCVDQDFRFDVMVIAKDCPPIKIFMKIRIGAQNMFRISERLPLPTVFGIVDDGNANSS
jgi:hypothetical protein